MPSTPDVITVPALVVAWVAMTRAPRPLRRRLLVIAMVSLLGAGLLGAFTVGLLIAATALSSRGVVTAATVVEVDEHFIFTLPAGGRWVTTVTVSFPDRSGGVVVATYSNYDRAKGLRQGASITVVYDPLEPTRVRDAARDSRAVDVIGLGLMALACCAVSVFTAVRWLRTKPDEWAG